MHRKCWQCFSVRKYFLLLSLSRSWGQDRLQESPDQLCICCGSYCAVKKFISSRDGMNAVYWEMLSVRYTQGWSTQMLTKWDRFIHTTTCLIWRNSRGLGTIPWEKTAWKMGNDSVSCCGIQAICLKVTLPWRSGCSSQVGFCICKGIFPVHRTGFAASWEMGEFCCLFCPL